MYCADRVTTRNESCCTPFGRTGRIHHIEPGLPVVAKPVGVETNRHARSQSFRHLSLRLAEAHWSDAMIEGDSRPHSSGRPATGAKKTCNGCEQ